MNKENAFNYTYGYDKTEQSNIHSTLRRDLTTQMYSDSAFHYTSFENCINMLKFDEGVLEDSAKMVTLEMFVSHFSFMNDPSELYDGLRYVAERLKMLSISNQVVQNVVADFQESLNEFTFKNSLHNYILSFSTDGNNLTQWKYYGRDCGVAIEYDLPNLEFSGWQNDENYATHNAFQVFYQKPGSNTSLNSILCKIENLSGPNAGRDAKSYLLDAVALTSFIKNEHYCDEREVRMLFTLYYNENNASAEAKGRLLRKIDFRPRNHDLVPYIRVRLRNKEQGCWPIKSITVGPGTNQERIYRALIMFIQTKYQSGGLSTLTKKTFSDDCKGVNVNGIDVKYSLIPFQG